MTSNQSSFTNDPEQKASATLAGTDRRVLILGGAGYIGGPVTSHLLRQGFNVRNLDLLIFGHQAAMTGYLPHPAYEFQYGDIGDATAVNKALEGVTDVIILAGLVGDPITKAYPQAAARVNDTSMRRVIDMLAGRGLRRVIFVSTCSNYGFFDEDKLADETSELKPLSLYAKSKVAAEQQILALKGKVDFQPTILRFATAFGLAPRMRFDLTVNEFTHDLYRGKELIVFDEHTWRPYCHVKDFGRLIEQVLLAPAAAVAFEVFNAGGDDNNFTKQMIVEQILSRLPEAKVNYQKNSPDPRNYRVSFAKVKQRLGFTPGFSVTDGIDEIIWALQNHLLDDADERRNFYGNYELPAYLSEPLRDSG